MKLSLIFIAVMTCLLSSCDESSPPRAENVHVEAPDYKPLGEGIKFLSLALLASTVVYSIASMVNNKNDHD